MFKWPGTPVPSASEPELADYAELVCWQKNLMSVTALSKQLGRLDENDYSDGVPEEDETDEVVKGAYLEIERRIEACRGGYPFDIARQGNTLRPSQDTENRRHTIYKYLLLATRLNMKSNRVHGGIDGTLLFEKLAAEAAKEYFGARAEKFVFGTAAGSKKFSGKIDDLCKQMKEGYRFYNHSDARPNVKDDKLDIVVWKSFTDGLQGKLIAFGQCKTGTRYKDKLPHLQPSTFCNKWLKTQPVVPPVRMFLIAEALSRVGWYNVACEAGLLFDRCRIVDFCDDISSDVWKQVTNWTKAAAAATGLPC
ncbi:MAG: hypothetical protein OXF97_05120 [Nitrospira sp.]|nr:hypothetical protein [Nitrospira sp.]